MEILKNSDEVYSAIEKIATAPGKSKADLIAYYMQDDLFRRVCSAALDPFTTYGVKNIDDAPSGALQFSETEWNLLARLASRELTGNAAQSEITAAISRLSPSSGELLRRIIRRDLRAGFSEKAVNKAVPGFIYTFGCMLAHKFTERKDRVKYPVFVEPKYDGVRALGIYKNGEVKFYSRTGNEFPNYGEIGRALVEILKGSDFDSTKLWVFDGEVVDRDFLTTVSSARSADADTSSAVYTVFEFLSSDEFFGGCSLPHYQRCDRMRTLFGGKYDPLLLRKVNQAPVGKADSEEEVWRMYATLRERGLEGVIVKDPNGLYERKRSAAWLKIKDCLSADVPIVGFYEGEGKFAGNLGGLVVDFNGIEVEVGSGLSDHLRSEIWSNKSKYLNRLTEVEYQEKMPSGSMRHPVFVRFRDDKPLSDGPGV